MVPPPFWAVVFLVALGGSLAGAMYMQARSLDPHPVFASRAERISVWIVAFGIIWLALSSILAKEYVGVALLLMVIACIWQTVLFLSPIVAPKWAARTWLHASDVAMARFERKPLPTLADSEREARQLGYWLIALGLLVWIGYWLASRWLGIWLLPVGFLVVLVVGILMTFRPHKDAHRHPLNPAESRR